MQNVGFLMTRLISTIFFHLFQSPNGKYIACGAIDGIINVFDIATGKVIHTLEG